MPKAKNDSMPGNNAPVRPVSRINGPSRAVLFMDQTTNIDEEIEHLSQVVSLTPESGLRMPRMPSKLGNSYLSRFESLGELSALNRAIEVLSQAVLLTSEGGSDKPGILDSLSRSYRHRFARMGELSDINRAIDIGSQAVSLTPESDSCKPVMLHNLSCSYRRRFERLGELSDIDRVIEVLSRAILLTPEDHSGKPDMLNNLGYSYGLRFGRLGELSDINRAIVVGSQAVLLIPESDFRKPVVLYNLSCLYRHRFKRSGELSDIERAFECLSQATSLVPPGHPNMSGMLSSLGDLHRRRANRLDVLLNNKRIIPLTPDSHADSILGNSRTHQPEPLGETADIDASTASLSQAVSLAPDGQVGGNTGQTTVEVVPSEMSISEIFNCLLEHRCVDISPFFDPRHSLTTIGGGSFGDVWKGKLISGETVAVKCIRLTTIVEDQPKGLKRLMRETYMWSKLKHHNVQHLMGITMFQGRLGMVSLWREHGDLRAYIRRNPGVNRHQLCVQVASGLSYLHSISMVHGDIKASNILVSSDGVAKLSDFDHSILSSCTLAFSTTTNVGGGTLRWMAPELLLTTDDTPNQGVLRTTQTDIYALGMTILEIFTRKVPYAEYIHDPAVFGALLKKQPPARPTVLTSPTTHADEMWGLLVECWNHDAVARPDARLVLSSLQKLNVKPPGSTVTCGRF